MEDHVFHQEGKLSLEKASELGKTLSKGGIALSDSQTAFGKRLK